MDFVVLDTEPVAVGDNYVPIILGRPFLATSNGVINYQNGVMQLTFGNMTLELNFFHLSKKHVHPEEEGLEEVCLIETIVEEQCEKQQLQVELIEELTELPEKVNDPQIYVLLFVLREIMKKSSHFLLRKTVERKQRKSPKSLISNPSPQN